LGRSRPAWLKLSRWSEPENWSVVKPLDGLALDDKVHAPLDGTFFSWRRM
jgi:hypothetical protein